MSLLGEEWPIEKLMRYQPRSVVHSAASGIRLVRDVTPHREVLWSLTASLDGRPVRVDLRRLTEIEEFRQCEQLQDRIWGPDDIGRVSSLVLITSEDNGGSAIGAFVDGDRLVGFVCSFLGFAESGMLKHCSVLMAVDPELQKGGIGYHLKLAQREAALAQGIELITWTFDPLASLNAHLNIHKLGCVSSRYLVNCYGTAQGGINAGLPTDRFLVEWWVRRPWVESRLRGLPAEPPAGARLVNEVTPHPHSGLPVSRDCDLDLHDPVLLVEIPENVRALKMADLDLARAWRLELRRIFPHYFAQGYRVTGFSRCEHGGVMRPCYVLRKGDAV